MEYFPQQIASVTERIDGITKDIAAYTAHKEKCIEIITTSSATNVTHNFPGMTINGVTHTEKEPASKVLLEACKGLSEKSE